MAIWPPESNPSNTNPYLPFSNALFAEVIVTVADPELLGAVTEVAETVTVLGDGIVSGAV
jgi:hypothetical protein